MIQSAKGPMRDLPTSGTSQTKSIPINNNSRARDRGGSDLSNSPVSNASSLFDHVPMSDTASVASSIPSDYDDHEIDPRFHPPRVSSKTYVHQYTETIEEDPNEDVAIGDHISPNAASDVQTSKTSDSFIATTPPHSSISTEEPAEDGFLEIKRRHPPHNHETHATAKSSAHVEKSTKSAIATTSTTAASQSPTLTPAKKEKSGIFHFPKLTRPKSHTALPAEAKLPFKESIKNIIPTGNNSSNSVGRRRSGSRTPSPPGSAPGTPSMGATKPPARTPVMEPIQPPPSPPSPPLGESVRRVASAGPNMHLIKDSRGNPIHHDEARQPAAGQKAVQGRSSRSPSDPPAAPGVVRAKTLKECGITNRGKQAGKGATATVTRCSSSNGRVVALKSFKKPQHSSESEAELKHRIDAEFDIAHRLHHPNVIETMELIWDEGKHSWAETMEWCGGGDLFSIIKSGHMTALERNCCFKQLIRGVAYMHSMGIAHRDIKPENLLLNEESQLKITDFGVSNIVIEEGGAKRKCHGLCGSEPYMAPELHTHDEYDGFPLDIWGCGVVYVCLAFGGNLWHKAAKGDVGFERYMHSLRDFEEKKAKKEAKRAAEKAANSHGNDDHGNGAESDGDKGSDKSENGDTMSRVPSVLSIKIVPPSGSPRNSPSSPVTPTAHDAPPLERKLSNQSTPQHSKSLKVSPTVKPVQSPLPIAQAASATRGEARFSTPHYLPFESLQPLQKRLLYRMLDPNPETRITAAEILKDPWFKEIQCCSYDPDELYRVQSGRFDASKMSGHKKPMPVKHKHPNHLLNGKAKK